MKLYTGDSRQHSVRLAWLTVLGFGVSAWCAFTAMKATLYLTTGYVLATHYWLAAMVGAVPTYGMLTLAFRASRLTTLRGYLIACAAWPLFYAFVAGSCTGLYSVFDSLLPNTYGRKTSSLVLTVVAIALTLWILRLIARYSERHPNLVVRGSPLGTIVSVTASIRSVHL